MFLAVVKNCYFLIKIQLKKLLKIKNLPLQPNFMKKIELINRKTGELIRETPPNERFLRFLFHNPFGKLPMLLMVRRKLVSVWAGNQMDKEKSAKRIAPFVETFKVDMSEAVLKVSDFKTFNEFFYRTLKPNARPIAEGIVSPADGKVLAFENVEKTKDFFVKGNKFTIDKFFQFREVAKQFQNASLIIIRLAPDDYHRFHFPYSGKISASTLINGTYYSVSPYAVKENFTIFCENKREFSILETKDKGNILISEIGATMVGAIFQTYKANTEVAKGDEKGYFAFGGSSVILLVDADKIKIDADILQNTKNGYETTVKMGERIGL